jgi:hypothetical protein
MRYIFDLITQSLSYLNIFFKFDSSSFGLGRNQLVNTSAYPDIVNAYKNYMLQTALLLGATDDSRTHNEIEEILKFESNLAAVIKF